LDTTLCRLARDARRAPSPDQSRRLIRALLQAGDLHGAYLESLALGQPLVDLEPTIAAAQRATLRGLAALPDERVEVEVAAGKEAREPVGCRYWPSFDWGWRHPHEFLSDTERAGNRPVVAARARLRQFACDEDLLGLASLSTLTTLSIFGRPTRWLRGEVLEDLLPALPLLRSLRIDGLELAREAALHLPDSESLQELDLGLSPSDVCQEETLLLLAGCSALRRLKVHDARWTERHVDGLQHLERLERLEVAGELTPRAVEGLRLLPELAELSVSLRGWSEESIVSLLRGLPPLRALELGLRSADVYPNPAPRAHAVLGQLTELEELDVRSVSSDDALLEAWPPFHLLRRLSLSGPVGERGISSLSRHPLLKELHVSSSLSVDRAWGRLSSLESLDIYGCPTTPTAIDSLANLSCLRELSVSGPTSLVPAVARLLASGRLRRLTLCARLGVELGPLLGDHRTLREVELYGLHGLQEQADGLVRLLGPRWRRRPGCMECHGLRLVRYS
jgi:hypothetical protein